MVNKSKSNLNCCINQSNVLTGLAQVERRRCESNVCAPQSNPTISSYPDHTKNGQGNKIKLSCSSCQGKLSRVIFFGQICQNVLNNKRSSFFKEFYLIASFFFFSACFADLPIFSSSYLGDISNDEGVYGVRIKSNGDIVLAAEIGKDTEVLKSSANFANLDASVKVVGAVILLSLDGKTVKNKAIVSKQIRDIALDKNDNIYVAAGENGLISLSPDISKIRWQALIGTYIHRVDVGADGTVAALAPTSSQDPDSKAGPGTITLFDANGSKIANFAGHTKDDRNTLDVCVDGVSKTVVVVGWRQAADWSEAANRGGPVQIAFMRGLSYDGTEKWKAYDWSTDGASEKYLNKPENNMADTRGLRCCIGDDRKLYAIFMCAGGNHIFRYNPFDITKKINLAKGDKFNDFSGTKSEHKTYFGRYNPANGEYELGQQLTARVSLIKTNALWCDRGDIAADKDGRVYFVGTSAYGLPIWPNKLLDKSSAKKTFNPFGVGSYLGGPFLIVNSPGFTSREYVTRISPYGGNGRTIAVREIAGNRILVWGGSIALGGPAFTKNPLQPSPGYGINDAFFTIHKSDNGEKTDSTLATLNSLSIDVSGDVSEKKSMKIRNSDPEKQLCPKDESSGQESISYFYPWSDTTPLTPNSSDYNGQPLYGGLRVEIQNHDASRKGINKKEIESPFKLFFGAKRQNNEKLLIRGAIYAKVSDCDNWKHSDKVSFDINSSIQVNMGCPAFLTYPWINDKGETVWKTHFWLITEFRWLVKDSGKFYLSKISPIWKSHQDQQLQLGFENDSDDGEWAEWTPTDSLAFDSKSAKFAKMNFQNIEGIGFWLSDPDFRPTNESENAGVNKPKSADAVLKLESLSATLALNSVAAQRPKANFSISNIQPSIGEEIIVDAGSSEPGEGTINFIAWDFGDGFKISGKQARHSYTNYGPHILKLTIWNDKLQSASLIKRVEVFPKGLSTAEKKKIVAALGGFAPEKFPNIERNSKPLIEKSKGIEGDNILNLRTEVPYDETIPFTTLSGTRVYAGWTDETRIKPEETKNQTHINNSLAYDNPAKYKKIDSRGLWTLGYRVRQNIPGRVRFIGMIMKEDFLNGWNDAAKKITLGNGERFIAGPFQEIAPESGKIRFVIKDPDGYWASEKYVVGPPGRKDSLSFDSLPVFSMEFSNSGDDGKWAKFDPSQNLQIDKSAKFAPRKFKDILGFGILGDSETIGEGYDLKFYELRFEAAK